MTLVIPEALIEEVRRGRAVLLLGSGASLGAHRADGRQPPTTAELRDSLADRFLGGGFRDSSLAWVAELAISETDLGTVQDFIAEMLRDMEPAPFHLLLPTFRWRGLATTNYDTVVETTYRTKGRIQTLVPIYSDRDRLDEKLRAGNDLALLKLHGCVTRTRDSEIPLILTVDQYVTHRTGRSHLFQTLEEWGSQFPVVFVGHAGQDPDIRELLLEVSKDQQWRPRFYLLKPSPTDAERRLWESKRITVLDGSFEDFLSELDRRIPAPLRPLLSEVDVTHPIHRRFVVAEPVSAMLTEILRVDFEYIHASLPVADGNPKDFYRGFDFGWYSIANNLDVRRTLTDRLLTDVIIQPEEDRPSLVELYVIKAEAGAGKSVFLRRLAWEAGIEADVVCLYLRQDGLLRPEGLREIYRVTKQRLFVFVDNAARHAQDLEQLVTTAKKERLPVTIFTAERVNAWNMSCERLVPLLTEIFELRYLSHSELELLVDLLEKYDSLGPNLAGKSRNARVRQFEERAGRQLLVALHEATLGIPFEDILFDEYQQVEPNAARQLYLTVCVLNRLNVGVRAGLIARVHGIRFEEFRSKLFAPLEHVVRVDQHPGTQDYLYFARHPEIAQIVFDRVLQSPVDRYHEYVRIVSQLNLAYTTDRIAFRGLIRAKALHDLFPDYQNVRAIFDAAERIGPKEAYVYQQEANYERIRPDGNLARAELLLERARELDPRDFSILHTLAEINRTKAEHASHRLERERFRSEARALLVQVLNGAPNDRYARVTIIKIALDELTDVLARGGEASDTEIDNAVRAVEYQLERALQQYPNEPFLLTAEAEFGRLLRDDERSFLALKRAFDGNKRDPYIASRLSKLYEDRGDWDRASEVLDEALQGNRGDKLLNYQYATVLRRSGKGKPPLLVYHYRRAFTKWDTNFEAQFWFARYAFESLDPTELRDSKETFRHLREIPLAHDTRVQVRDTMGASEEPILFHGKLARKEYAHGFVERDGTGDWIFCHKANTPKWDELKLGERMRFHIGFTFRGAIALDLDRS